MKKHFLESPLHSRVTRLKNGPRIDNGWMLRTSNFYYYRVCNPIDRLMDQRFSNDEISTLTIVHLVQHQVVYIRINWPQPGNTHAMDSDCHAHGQCPYCYLHDCGLDERHGHVTLAWYNQQFVCRKRPGYSRNSYTLNTEDRHHYWNKGYTLFHRNRKIGYF